MNLFALSVFLNEVNRANDHLQWHKWLCNNWSFRWTEWEKEVSACVRRTCGRVGPEVLGANSLGLWKLSKGRVRAHTHDISALQVLFDSSLFLLGRLDGKAPLVRPLQGRDRPSRKCQRDDSCQDHTHQETVFFLRCCGQTDLNKN